MDFEQALLIKVRTDGTLEIQKLQSAVDGLGRSVNAAGSTGLGAGRNFDTLKSSVLGLTAPILGAAAGFLSLSAAVRGVMAGVRNADTLRDMEQALIRVSSSTFEAAQAMKFFEEQARRTRFTGDELIDVYARQLPLAMKRANFSEAGFQKMTVDLANFATATRKSLSEVEQAFAQIMRGQVRGPNPILTALGISSKDIEAGKISLQSLIPQIQKVAAEGEAMGQTFSSAGKKIADELLDSFSRGFNAARGEADKGMQGVVDALTDPAVLGAISAIGEAFANIVPLITSVVEEIAKLVGGLRDVSRGAGEIIGKIGPGRAAQVGAGGFFRGLFSGGGLYGGAMTAAGAVAGESAAIDQGLGVFADDKLPAQVRKTNAETDKLRNTLEKTARAARQIPEAFGPDRQIKEFLEYTFFLRNEAELTAQAFAQLGSIVAGLEHETLTRDIKIDDGFLKEFWSNFAEEMEREGDDIAEAWAKAFQSPLTNVFTDLAATGGQNFGAIMGAEFLRAIEAGAGKITDLLGGLLGGGQQATFNEQTGQWMVGNRGFENRALAQQEANRRNANATRGAQMGLTGLAIGVGAYQQAAEGASILETAISGAVAGAQFGPWGAVAGAVVGIVAGMLGSAEQEESRYYGQFGVRAGGEAFFTGTQNISSADALKYTAQIQDQFNKYLSGYTNLLIKLPGDISQTLMTSLQQGIMPRVEGVGGTGGIDSGQYDVGSDASREFFGWFDAWMKQRLPREIAARFRQPFEEAFTALGLSGERFAEIWSFLDTVDPEKALELMGILTEGLMTLDRTMSLFSGDFSQVGEYGALETGYIGGRAETLGRERADRTIFDELGDLDTTILEKAALLQVTTGEQQIRIFGEVTQLLEQRYQMELRYIDAIMGMLETANQTIEAALRENAMRGMDPDQQIDFLYDYYAELESQLLAATNPEEANRLFQEMFATIQQITGLGMEIDPEYFQQWERDTLLSLQGEFNSVMSAILANLDTFNQGFSTDLQPHMDAFTSATDTATTAATGVAGGFDLVTDSAHRVIVALDDLEGRANAVFAGIGNAAFELETAGSRP